MSIISRREFLAVPALAGLAGVARADGPKLTISTFTTEVTPPIGHPCMGGGIAPVREILDPLFAHGVIIRSPEKPVVIVAVDWCEIRNDAYDRWRDAIAGAVGTTRERVLVSALHQHDTPIADLTAQKHLEAAKAKGAICDLAFHEQTVRRVAKAARESLDKSRPLTHIGTGQAEVKDVASNRRYVNEAGEVRYDRMSASRDPKIRAGETGTIDPMLKTLSLWDGDTPVVALSSYATHPMSHYGKGGTTADFVGMARRMRQGEEPGTLQIYISGCSGNVTAGKFNDGSPDNRPVLAKKIHAAMKSAWANTKREPITQCVFRSVPLKLEARSAPAFAEAELKKQIAESPRPFSQCLAALGLSWLQRVKAGEPVDVCCLDFGSAAYLLMPAESYVEFQLMAQAARPKDFVMVAGYGESGPGYIPIERAWKEHDNNLTDWCWVNPGSEALMKSAIETALKK